MPDTPVPTPIRPTPAAQPDATPAASPEPQVIIRPLAGPTHARARHWGLLVSFLALVLLPLAVVGWYVSTRAVDQFASDVGFTVRQEDGNQTSALLGGLAQLAGPSASGGAADGDILHEFIQSQGLVRRIDARLDLWAHYSAPHDADPVFALAPDGSIEDLHAYWRRAVAVEYDQATGLIALEIRAFDPAFAQTLGNAILDESQALVNALNAKAREDLLHAAETDVDAALARLKTAREALVTYRTRTQIVDPEADMETRLGVQTSLQQQLAQALVEYDLLIQTAGESAPSVIQARRRIEVIRARIAEERAAFAGDPSDGADAPYPALIAEYESLVVDREYAEETYRAALAQLDSARANAARQSRYLAAFVQPTLPESAQYPRRAQIIGMSGLFLVLGWALLALIFYSLRDRR